VLGLFEGAAGFLDAALPLGRRVRAMVGNGRSQVGLGSAHHDAARVDEPQCPLQQLLVLLSHAGVLFPDPLAFDDTHVVNLLVPTTYKCEQGRFALTHWSDAAALSRFSSATLGSIHDQECPCESVWPAFDGRAAANALGSRGPCQVSFSGRFCATPAARKRPSGLRRTKRARLPSSVRASAPSAWRATTMPSSCSAISTRALCARTKSILTASAPGRPTTAAQRRRSTRASTSAALAWSSVPAASAIRSARPTRSSAPSIPSGSASMRSGRSRAGSSPARRNGL